MLNDLVYIFFSIIYNSNYANSKFSLMLLHTQMDTRYEYEHLSNDKINEKRMKLTVQ